MKDSANLMTGIEKSKISQVLSEKPNQQQRYFFKKKISKAKKQKIYIYSNEYWVSNHRSNLTQVINFSTSEAINGPLIKKDFRKNSKKKTNLLYRKLWWNNSKLRTIGKNSKRKLRTILKEETVFVNSNLSRTINQREVFPKNIITVNLNLKEYKTIYNPSKNKNLKIYCKKFLPRFQKQTKSKNHIVD